MAFDLKAALCNPDGSIKQEFLDGVFEEMERQEKERKDYEAAHLEEDYLTFVRCLENEEFLDSDENPSIVGIDKDRYQLFFDVVFKLAEDVPDAKFGMFSAAIRKYRDLYVELIVGQGSFFRVVTDLKYLRNDND